MLAEADESKLHRGRPCACLSVNYWRIHKRRGVAVLAASLVALFVYWKLLVAHGTLSPIGVWLYTARYDPQSTLMKGNSNVDIGVWAPPDTYARYLAGEDPPAEWRPKSRVVVTLSTLPHHKDVIHEALDTLVAQSVKPDAIYLALPEKSRRTGLPYGDFSVPDGVTILRSAIDYGPLTKLLPAVQAETDPSTIIITVDDDKLYHRDTVKILAWHAEHK
jgi:hypothetical protein